jgi:hypothetical protein
MAWERCQEGLGAVPAGPRGVLRLEAGVRELLSGRGRDGWGVAVCAWSGGGWVPAPVFEELGEVVDGAEELDLGVGGVVAAVAEVAAEPGE